MRLWDTALVLKTAVPVIIRIYLASELPASFGFQSNKTPRFFHVMTNSWVNDDTVILVNMYFFEIT